MPVRRAIPADAFDLAAIHVTVWRETYRGMMPDTFLDGFTIDAFRKRWSERLQAPEPRVAILTGELKGQGIVGFGVCGPTRDGRLGTDGEIYAINIIERGKHKGLGTQLMFGLAKALQENGFKAPGLWVLEANVSARKFYDRLSGVIGETVEHEFGGRALPEIAYTWKSTGILQEQAARLIA